MKKAFTLIELLTVMAISAIMLTLIVLPVFQSFNVLRTAQAFADAQDKGRLLTERIAREIGNAVAVRNIGGTYADSNGDGTAETFLANTKIDLVPPAQGTPERDANGKPVYRDPDTGKIDPTLTRPKGDIHLPVEAGQVYVRWWVGLNRPTEAYNEPYTGILMPRNGRRDNLYVLRRAEVQPFVYRLRKDGAGPMRWRPNLAYFRSDDQVSAGAEFDTRILDLDDPYFFVRNGQYPLGTDDPFVSDDNPGKNGRVDNWAKVSTIQTEVSRYDMIRPVLQGSPPQVPKDGSRPSVLPLIQFRPTRVSATPAAGNASAKPGMGADGSESVGSDTFTTERGLWMNAIVRYYPRDYSPGNASPFEIATIDVNGGVTISAGGSSTDGLDGILDAPNNFALFDLKTYEQTLALGGSYPFTRAAQVSDQFDLDSQPFPARLWTPEESMRRTFMPFRVLTGTGKIITSFNIEDVGENPLNTNRPNLPFVTIGSGAWTATQAPQNDPNLATAPLSPVSAQASNGNPYDVNRAFNRVWNAYPELQGVVQRFIDLRFVPNEDGTFSPLYPTAQSRKIQGFSFPNGAGGSQNRVRIMPGSDEVYGPDQNSGPNNGAQVRYTRTTGNPGPNQYRLVYADLPEPTNSGNQVDYSVLGLPAALNPAAFDATAFTNPAFFAGDDVIATQIQPRYKAGYLQLCSDPNVPLLPGRITVRYRFAFNGPKDTFVVDHDTREVLQVLLTVKNYPQANVPNAQTITLKSTATLRNALR